MLGIGDRVRVFRFSGRVEPHLLALDGFVLPSHQFEVLSIGTIEAMACGLAVVATRVGGVPEVVADGDSGRLVPPGDPAAIASAISELAADDALRERMGERGREIAAERFRMDRMVDEIEALYLELVAGACAVSAARRHRRHLRGRGLRRRGRHGTRWRSPAPGRSALPPGAWPGGATPRPRARCCESCWSATAASSSAWRRCSPSAPAAVGTTGC